MRKFHYEEEMKTKKIFIAVFRSTFLVAIVEPAKTDQRPPMRCLYLLGYVWYLETFSLPTTKVIKMIPSYVNSKPNLDSGAT